VNPQPKGAGRDAGLVFFTTGLALGPCIGLLMHDLPMGICWGILVGALADFAVQKRRRRSGV
jgi:hypothetical protein